MNPYGINPIPTSPLTPARLVQIMERVTEHRQLKARHPDIVVPPLYAELDDLLAGYELEVAALRARAEKTEAALTAPLVGDTFASFFAAIAADDQRTVINGYAPGTYFCRCANCKQQFMGDKRAHACPKCAYEEPMKALTAELQQVRAELLQAHAQTTQK